MQQQREYRGSTLGKNTPARVFGDARLVRLLVVDEIALVVGSRIVCLRSCQRRYRMDAPRAQVDGAFRHSCGTREALREFRLPVHGRPTSVGHVRKQFRFRTPPAFETGF